MNIVVLSIDRLHAGYLGCYGNSWVATPHFNRLAAESFVFDQATIDQPRLESLLSSWWTGRHVLERTGSDHPLTLAERLGAAGFATALVTDEPRVAVHPLVKHFADRVTIEAVEPSSDCCATDASETCAAALFAAAADRLSQAKPPFFCWVHSRGMEAPWDAPDAFRQQYAEPGEPDPPRLAAVPCRRLAGDEDPDELWGFCQSYAGQVSLFDACLGGLLESLSTGRFERETLLIVIGLRGFALGRNGRIGAADDALYSELVQLPWLMRFPGQSSAAVRSQALVQPCDLAPTLADLLSLAVAEEPTFARSLLPLVREDVESVRDRACLIGAGGERALRTDAWYLRLGNVAEGTAAAELYAKPDDRWEQNDVANRCPEVVDGLRGALDELEQALASQTLGEISTPIDFGF